MIIFGVIILLGLLAMNATIRAVVNVIFLVLAILFRNFTTWNKK